MRTSRRSGRNAETFAAEYLQALGYKIVARNVYVGRWGEIDLVAYDGNMLVFVEVKARSSYRFGLPEEGVTPRKQRLLLRAARAYLSFQGLGDIPCRFDVVAIDMGVSPPRVRLYQNAFGSEEAF
ncbi:MAG: YraN family protein [Candidatus Kapabacteria bacterium]|nr:YraN family protein [Candidatus Kapabacteria bacterium]MDW8225087.1 YraN family protein [Bacteroidota bacterium]